MRRISIVSGRFVAIAPPPHLLGLLLLVATLTGKSSTSFAHPELQIRIDAVTSDILKQPENGELYLRRAELHREHLDWPSALADYSRAEIRRADVEDVHLRRGTMYAEAGLTTDALREVDFLLGRNSQLGGIHLLRANALQSLGKFAEAADAYTSAIARTPDSLEAYLDRAEALIRTGETTAAIRGLDEGIARIGPIVNLQLKAVEYQTRLKNYDDAAARLRVMIVAAPRKEFYLLRLAEVQFAAGQLEAARSTCRDALGALQSLPARIQTLPANQELGREIRELQKQLN